uniref:Uncharacterized protein n=1 Tax=Anopheles darlingi TaxID=43151 RepID=A0A2M4DK95_ANODA
MRLLSCLLFVSVCYCVFVCVCLYHFLLRFSPFCLMHNHALSLIFQFFTVCPSVFSVSIHVCVLPVLSVCRTHHAALYTLFLLCSLVYHGIILRLRGKMP